MEKPLKRQIGGDNKVYGGGAQGEKTRPGHKDGRESKQEETDDACTEGKPTPDKTESARQCLCECVRGDSDSAETLCRTKHEKKTESSQAAGNLRDF